MKTAERFAQIESALTAAETEIAVLTHKKSDLEQILQDLFSESGTSTKEELAAKIAAWDAKIETALSRIEAEARSLGLLT